MRKAFAHIQFTLRLPVELGERVKKLADYHICSTADLLREYIKDAVTANELENDQNIRNRRRVKSNVKR